MHPTSIQPGPPNLRGQHPTSTKGFRGQSRVRVHFELEFENPSGVHTPRLLANAGRTALEAERQGAVDDQVSTCSSSSSHTTPPSTTISTKFGQPPHQQLSSAPLATNTAPSTERRRHKCGAERVSKDHNTTKSHPMVLPENSHQQGDNQTDAEIHQSTSAGLVTEVTEATSQLPVCPPSQAEESEEEDWVLDEELARQGLYRGSYWELVGLYTLTPAFTLLVFCFLAYIPPIAYPFSPGDKPQHPYPYAPYLPFPFPEFFTATAFWALSHLLNSPVFSFFSLILSPSSLSTLCLSSLTQGAVTLVLRQATIPILLIPQNVVYRYPTCHDVSFRRVWWIALGWAAAEAVVGIKQGYQGIALYRDVLVSVTSRPNPSSKLDNSRVTGYGSIGQDNLRDREAPRSIPSSGDAERQMLLERRPSVVSVSVLSDAEQLREAIEEEVERDIDALIALRTREELEDLYGMPIIHIPVFISCLHRFNSALFILGSTLLLTAAYMASTFSPGSPPLFLHRSLQVTSKGSAQFLIAATFPIVLLLQWLLSILHTPPLLPRIGVQTFVFIGSMVSLGVFFAGLGVWGGIV